ncbi:FKBP-type peptidyl-prolyl cis-trans isomerase [Pseudomonas sp. GD03944]|uniref:FKBP-type peptidyl-prolyl cis-trans isomerase n=1 Tax=Pseudomonas sp. GD03944 TaxID=2975409 RepID=UPI0024493404|nr:FKBP-type peptidyl-prolyl cis-trans isomerase [Pseudomonas sp. GD03944]MDH1264001.1 FKBP-type peptidyl-prolyl cis-trans isomerase [Pseudomonas sp. GD03944]
MQRVALLLFCLITPLAHAEPDADELAYSLGVRLGERLRDEVPDLQVQALVDGLRHAYHNEPLRLDEARIESLLAEHEAHLAAVPERIERAIAAEKRFLANEKAKPGMRELKDGVLRQELRAGSGRKPTAKSRVQVRYVGSLADGSEFDESQAPQWFRLDSVIAGWRTALQEMPVGAHWRLVIPSAQAYGADGAGDLIPPYSPLVFELELLDTRD